MNSLRKKLTIPEAITEGFSLVAHEVCRLREQNEKEFEWYKSHAGLATKQDLDELGERLIKAIAESAKITPAVESAAIRLGAALDKLDAQIPDKRRKV